MTRRNSTTYRLVEFDERSRRLRAEIVTFARGGYDRGLRTWEVADLLRRTCRGSFAVLTRSAAERDALIESVCDDARADLAFDPDYDAEATR